MVDLLRNEGSITVWLRREEDDWPTNTHNYDFGTVANEGNYRLEAIKYANGTLEVTILGALGEEFELRGPLPETASKAVFVQVAWDRDSATLSLNGEAVQTLQV